MVPCSSPLQFIDMLVKGPKFEGKLHKPSVSSGGKNLYMQAPPVLEEMTRANLTLPLYDLLDSKDGLVNVNDKKLTGVLRLRVSFSE